ncbi:MAG: secretin N-terminal domain-containing protein [Gallionella sp.]|jgi:general secretion pathway protein D
MKIENHALPQKNHHRMVCMSQFAIAFRRRTVLLMVGVMLVGCTAGERLHKDGMALLNEGETEQGLAKLQEAVKVDPDNVSYRIALTRNRAQTISRMLMLGNNERVAGHPEASRAAYQRVLKIDPNNMLAKGGLAALKMDGRHNVILDKVKNLVKKGDMAAARDALNPVLLENPRHEEALALQRKLDELIAKEQSAGPALMVKFKKPVTLQFRDANLKMVFEALSRTSGINVMLDKDVKPDLKTSIFVKDVSVEDAINLIMLQNQLEKNIISENTVFIYPSTPEKIKNYRNLKVRSFHLTNADPKQMLTMLKTLLKTKDIFIHEKTNSIVMRDTPEAVRLAERMIADQDIAEPEVMMEVEVLEVNRTRATNLGIQWPTGVTLTAVGNAVLPGAAAGTAGAASQTLNGLRHLNGNNIIVSPQLSVTLNALLTDSDTNILASPRIRARNREKAKIMIGDRVPVITNAVTPVSTGTPVVTGNVQYLDVGLKLDVEPDIHLDGEVAIRINLEVSSIVKEVPNVQSGTLAYQIGTRNASTLLQLKDGETQILAGLIDNEGRENANKVPGLGQMPMLGRLFSNHATNDTKTEIILSITPHIVGRLRVTDAREMEYWSGTEGTLRDSSLTLKPVNATNAPAAAAAVSGQPASPQQLPVPALTPAPMQVPIPVPDQAQAPAPVPEPVPTPVPVPAPAPAVAAAAAGAAPKSQITVSQVVPSGTGL